MPTRISLFEKINTKRWLQHGTVGGQFNEGPQPHGQRRGSVYLPLVPIYPPMPFWIPESFV